MLHALTTRTRYYSDKLDDKTCDDECCDDTLRLSSGFNLLLLSRTGALEKKADDDPSSWTAEVVVVLLRRHLRMDAIMVRCKAVSSCRAGGAAMRTSDTRID